MSTVATLIKIATKRANTNACINPIKSACIYKSTGPTSGNSNPTTDQVSEFSAHTSIAISILPAIILPYSLKANDITLANSHMISSTPRNIDTSISNPFTTIFIGRYKYGDLSSLCTSTIPFHCKGIYSSRKPLAPFSLN